MGLVGATGGVGEGTPLSGGVGAFTPALSPGDDSLRMLTTPLSHLRPDDEEEEEEEIQTKQQVRVPCAPCKSCYTVLLSEWRSVHMTHRLKPSLSLFHCSLAALCSF